MGLKRPFNAEEVQELNLKHARPLTYDNDLTQLDVVFPYHVSSRKPSVIEEMSDLCRSESEDEIEGDTWNENASSFEEDAGSGATIQSSLSHESPDSVFPWRPLSPVENDYFCLMDRSPRKQVPIGPNYQAVIPEFGRPVKEEILDEDEERLMGKCTIPAPDGNVSGTEVCVMGKGRNDCLCWDKGTVRCVRQHTMEAREDLMETIGYEKFVKLGFCEMGEEVSRKWTEEEQDLFHEVVYSNPASLDRNFWKHLEAAFPSRTINELVSYYFNVFVLQRRAVQNRCQSLDIDSDDDEWRADYDTFYGAQAPPGEEEDSFLGSSFHRHTGQEYKKSLSHGDNNGESNCSDDNDSDNNNNIDGDRGGHMDKVSGNDGEAATAEDGSCMSLEFQPGLVYTRSPKGNKEKPDTGKCWHHHRFDGCCDIVNQLYSFDACDTRLLPNPWTKSVDLLPTSNMIEEIFGLDAWEDHSEGSK
ncbi:PREDICTED: uncharacterized protein LOC104805188 [Tarenaya hassleriana]|uniref:uncharacterized protein LOC104805188 n=1 Tax=Tarenaya hassleriana TaxID=28532 RepID=UPI00053C260C|nr:PREDICTED: uncharacterized protein LOC104805188 [Tarenaya hassleriana]